MNKLLMKTKHLFGQDTKTLIRIKINNLIDDIDTCSKKELKLKIRSIQYLMEELE